MTDLSKFQQYYNLAEQLLERSSKEEIAECARILAMNIAHYQSKYGELPLDEKQAMLSADKPNDDQLVILSDGMEILVGVLGTVISGLEQIKQ